VVLVLRPLMWIGLIVFFDTVNLSFAGFDEPY